MQMTVSLIRLMFLFGLAGLSLAAAPLEPTRRMVSDSAWSGSSVNMMANLQSSLFTEADQQYAVFYDAEGRLVLARRALEQDYWETWPSPYLGNVSDAHNFAVLAVDGEGVLHVAWDHHDSPLNYVQGKGADSLEVGERLTMTGQNEGKVTYPAFLRLPDGDLLFLYRDGESGRGNLVLNRYRLDKRRWARVQDCLLDGEGKRSAYASVAMGPQGWLHLAWTWRETPDVATNHDLCYAVSKDGGLNWENAAGEPLSLPIGIGSPTYAARIPIKSRLMNPPSVAADPQGRPLIANYWAAEGSDSPEYRVVTYRDGGWKTHQVTRRGQPFELAGSYTKRPPISRASLLAGEAGVVLVFRDDDFGENAVAYWNQDGTLQEWSVVSLTEGGLGAWEPSIDPMQWMERVRIHMLIQRVEQVDGRDDVSLAGQRSPLDILEVTLQP